MKGFLCAFYLLLMTGLFSDWFREDTYAATKEFPSFHLNHQTKNKQVLVECVVSGISFRESKLPGKKVGKILIWIDGQRKAEAAQAAFIIKGLSPGSHKIMLEVVNLQNEPYGLRKDFMVNIPR